MSDEPWKFFTCIDGNQVNCKLVYRIIFWMRPANERRRYIVTSSLIGWAHAQNDPCL